MTKTPLNSFEPSLLKSFTAPFDSLKNAGLLTPALTFEQLNEQLNDNQKNVVEQITNLKPKDYGVGTPYVGLEPVPDDLVKTEDGKLVPRRIHDAFERMNKAFKSEHPSRALLIGSGYRSPAYQVVTFINWCQGAYGGDIARTIRHASPPAYSQHTNANKTALDFRNIDGSPTSEHPEDFQETVEYEWLRSHANKFGFYESWPEGNEFGMRAEPWHWQFKLSPGDQLR